MAVTTLSGTAAIIGAVTSINISSIVFKQGNAVALIINSNLPSVNASDNTWTLDNNNTWTSKLTQGNYTVTDNLSGNGGSVTNPSSIVIAVDIVKPSQPKLGCWSNIGLIVSTIIHKVFLLISDTLPA
jgi:hypothetical protein